MLGRDASPVFRQYAGLVEDALGDVGALHQELQAAIDKVAAERKQVTAELAKVYLHELSPEALTSADQRTGYRALTTRRPLEALAREAKKLGARVVTLEADERWVRREALVGPHGAYTRELAEAKDLLDPWERDCARFEDLDGFVELVNIGYDTPAFTERWWEPVYWRHWAAGDRICEALGLADFGDDVLPAYEAARAPRDKWRAEVARIQQNIQQVHDHVRQHDEAAWRLANLAQIYLDECQDQLAKHLERADVGLLATWAGDDRAVLVQLKRLSGLGAKLEMLQEMQAKWLEPNKQGLLAARQKYLLKAEKFARPKKGATHTVMPTGVEEKLVQGHQRRQKARATVHRIVHFDTYDRFDLAQPPETWWLHIHDNRAPGVFTPTLRTWYDRHPNVTVVTDPDWESERGDALAAREVLASAGDIS